MASAAGMILGGAIVGGATLATATPTPSPTSACVHKYLGSIRVITGYSTSCMWYEYPVELGSGPSGPTGPTGPIGPSGPSGPAGADGDDGGYYAVAVTNSDNPTQASCTSGDLAVYATSSSGNASRVDLDTFEKTGAGPYTVTVYCIPEAD